MVGAPRLYELLNVRDLVNIELLGVCKEKKKKRKKGKSGKISQVGNFGN